MRQISYIKSFCCKKNKYLLKVATTTLMLILFTLPAMNAFGAKDPSSNQATALQIKVSGTIVSAKDGQPIPGVNVLEKGTLNGTVTDIDGKYSLSVKSADAILVFSFVGYLQEEKPISGQSVIDVSLVEDVKKLDEVVVIGYGTQNKQTVTGSVSNLSQKAIASKPVSTIESALQGQVSGVSVTNNGGPGTSPTVRIRGIGSVNFASDPLYVVDGVPVGSLNNFDVKDIESVSVLKDAASAAIYGSRAANGVVLITTKKGKRDGKMSLNIDASQGFQTAWKTLDLMKRDEYLKFGKQLYDNAGSSYPTRWSHMSDPIYAGSTQTYAQTETDWQKEVFRTAPITQLNVDLSGGSDKFRIYSSFGSFQQDGIMIGTDYKRYSYRINTESQLNKFISVGQTLKVSYSDRTNQKTSGGRTLLKHMLNELPYMPVYDPTKLGGYVAPDANDGSDPENPVRVALQDENLTRGFNAVGTLYAEVKFVDWLRFKSTVGMEYTHDRTVVRNRIYNDGRNSRNENQLQDNRFNYVKQIYTNQITFDKTFGQHNINAVAVAEQEFVRQTSLNTGGNQKTNDLNQMSGLEKQSVSGNLEKRVLLSYLGRLNYAFADKYLLSASVRYDGSSVFAPGKKWGAFPGGSVGWVVSKENFMKNVALISNLKLRASYGSLGFNAVGSYPWQSTIASNNSAVFGNVEAIGSRFDRLANEKLEWEITKMTNIGFDLALLDNSITFSAEYYIRKVDNLLVNSPLPRSMGFANDPLANVGSMKNWGYDFNAGYNKSQGEFQYSVSANISFGKNEVSKLSYGAPEIGAGGQTGDYGGMDITLTKSGYPIQGFYGYVTDGIFQSYDEVLASATQTVVKDAVTGAIIPGKSTYAGDIKFKDLNNDGVINDKDRTFIGNYLPDFSYGLNFSASYKNFDISMLIQGTYGNDIYNGTKVLTQGMMRLFNQDKAVLNAWTPANTSTEIPRAVDGDPNKNSRTSDRFVEDGSYMRIKNLTLGYTLNNNAMPAFLKNAVSSVRIYVIAQNLLTLTGYSGYDPEVAAFGGNNGNLTNGVDFGQIPQPRTFIFGVRLSF